MKYILLFLLVFLQAQLKANEFVGLSDIQPGKYKLKIWRKTPILIYHRTEQQINDLRVMDFNRKLMLYPLREYALRYGSFVANSLSQGNKFNRETTRSYDDKWFISIGASPEEGVMLIVDTVNGLLVNAATGMKYDLAGRALSNNKFDLSIPDYEIDGDKLLFVEDSDKNWSELIIYKANLNAPLDEQIIEALRWQKLDRAEELILTEPKVVKQKHLNRAIMSYGIAYKQISFLRKAISYGAHVNILFKNNSTPLNSAVLGGHVEIVKLLLDSGAKIERICDVGQPSRCSEKTFDIAKLVQGMEKTLRQLIEERKKNTE